MIRNLLKKATNSIFVKWSFSKCIEDVEIGWKASPLLRQSILHSLNRAKGRKPKTQPYTDYWLARPAALFPPLPSCPAFSTFLGCFRCPLQRNVKYRAPEACCLFSGTNAYLSIFSDEFTVSTMVKSSIRFLRAGAECMTNV